MALRDAYNGKLKHKQICACLGWGSYEGEIIKMYRSGMSSYEIAEFINQNTPSWLSMTARSISRLIKAKTTDNKGQSEVRGVKESWQNAIKRGRVQWAWKENKWKRKTLNPKLRFLVLERDGFCCKLCGNTAKKSVLEVDHILAVCNGGENDINNLQTLCYECNKGKFLAKDVEI